MGHHVLSCVRECRTCRPKQEPASGPGSTTQDLQPWLEQAPKRLTILAKALGLFSAIGLTLNLLGPSVFAQRPFPSHVSAASQAVFLALTVGFLVLLKSGRFLPRTLVNLGLGYVIVQAFGISLLQQTQPLASISFVAVLIVLFPLFVPTTVSKTMLAAYGAALTGPLATWLYAAVTGQTPRVEGLWMTHAVNFVVATLAIVPAWTMRGLGRDVRQARQMGSYELTDPIGRGGMGEVWRADHRMLRRPAAIKLIKPDALGAATPEKARQLFQRFEREAQATAALHSPHTIEVYDFGMTEEGEFFYVMELLEGFDMESLVERHGSLPPERVVHLLLQIADSLEDAHRSGLIHRDIKPANIFVCRYGHKLDFVKVLDFGLVKSSDFEGDAKLTADGAAAGTPACMAPEIALGEGPIDHRVDLYALGCVAYWLLTGAMVFEAESNMQMVLKHVQQAPEAPSLRSECEIPPALDELVLSLLAKKPEDRPQTASEVARRLKALKLADDWDESRADRWWQAHRPEAQLVPSAGGPGPDDTGETAEAPPALKPAIQAALHH
jgi:eukaryotic-like serine/threonine-protein kinase